MKQRLFSRAGLLILALITLLLTIIVNQLFKGVRIDLTEDHLYTLSTGTHNLLDGLQDSATIEFFYSDSQTGDIPFIRNYARRVTELLDEYVLASKGKLKLVLVDPEPFSEEEDKASEYGLQAVPLGGSAKEVYFGLAITSDSDTTRREIISFIHPDKERFLEYDISKLAFSVTEKEKPKVAVLSGLQVDGGYDMTNRQSMEPWSSIAQLKQLYNVSTLSSDLDSIPDDIKLLVVIYPKDLSEHGRYAIDQFVLNGGRALVFVDPNAESDNQSDMMGMGGDKSATLEPLFQAWGVEMDTGKIIADATYALNVSTQGGRSIRHLGILGFDQGSFNQNDVVTTALKSVNMATVGSVSKRDEGTTELEVLLHSSNQSMLMDAQKFSFLFDPGSLYKGFKPTGDEYAVAVRVTGKTKSAYPEGKPEIQSSEDKQSEGKKEVDKAKETAVKARKENTAMHIAEAVDSINVIIVADTDVLTDRLWVQKTNFFGQQVVQPFANNGDYLINMVDNLVGHADLISIRSRGQFARSFSKVDELERAAEARFYQKEDELKQQLTETENKLRELQSKKEGSETLVMSAEQQLEVDNFVQEKLRIRKELRNVQHQLGKDIEKLGNHLKIINILGVPFLLTLFAFGFRLYRKKKR